MSPRQYDKCAQSVGGHKAFVARKGMNSQEAWYHMAVVDIGLFGRNYTRSPRILLLGKCYKRLCGKAQDRYVFRI